MDLKKSPVLLLTSIILFLPLIKSQNSQHNYYDNSLVYIKCSNQTQTLISTHNSLSSLFQKVLIPQSTHSNFFKTIAGGDRTAGISGLYQCRINLDNHQCHNCINTLPQHLITCEQAVAARIELNGCYFKYETDEFVEETGGEKHELLHETCSEEKVEQVGFVEVRDAAFLGLMEELGMSEEKEYSYHYEKDYENVHVIGECERDVMRCDCSECLGIASEIAHMDCGSSIWGKIYLDNCFLSYGLKLYSEEKKSDTGKKIAIVLGAATTLGVAFVLLRCFKSKCNKDDRLAVYSYFLM